MRKIFLLGTARLLYRCAELLAGHYGTEAVRILDIAPTMANKKYAELYSVRSGGKQELFDLLRGVSEPAFLLTVNCPYIIPADIIDKPELTLLNLHHALLPAHPGRNAEAWTIFGGDPRGGVTWHYLTADVDAGNVLYQGSVPIGENTTSLSLLKACEELALDGLRRLIPLEQLGAGVPQPVTGETRRLHRLREVPGDGVLDLDWTAEEMSRFLRAMDYGVLRVLGTPKLRIGGAEYQIKRYTIQKAAAGGDARSLSFDQLPDALTIRDAGTVIRLKTKKCIEEAYHG